MPNLNLAIFHSINGVAGKHILLDWFFVAMTSYTMQIVVFVVVGLYVLVYLPLVPKDPHVRFRALGNALTITIALLTTWFVVTLLKNLVPVERPFQTITGLHPLVSAALNQSFPSGHAAMSTALATLVYMHHKRLGALLFIFALVVAISRIYVGVHYPVDVLAGILIGYLIPTLFEGGFARKIV